jgi:uncharacterized repeat protein (TIGR03803 family)
VAFNVSSYDNGVFKITSGGQYSIFYTFSGAAGPVAGNGTNPGRLIIDAAGNLYGITYDGGLFDCGTVFRLSPTAQLALLYNFSGRGADGCLPIGGLVRDAEGNLYGVTTAGGKYGYGTVFRVSEIGRMDVLYNLAASDGVSNGDLIRDPAGNLYGTTYYGGTSGLGTVYKLDPSGNMTVLHHFTGGGRRVPTRRGECGRGR